MKETGMKRQAGSQQGAAVACALTVFMAVLAISPAAVGAERVVVCEEFSATW
jgi:hypothetical protein